VDTTRRFGGAFSMVGMVAGHIDSVTTLGNVVEFLGKLLKPLYEVLHTNHHTNCVMICIPAFDKNTHKS